MSAHISIILGAYLMSLVSLEFLFLCGVCVCVAGLCVCGMCDRTDRDLSVCK